MCPLPVTTYKPAPTPNSNFTPHNSTTMDRNFAAVAIFTLLFAVSTARISLDLTPTDLQVERSNDRIRPDCKVEDSNLAVVPTDTKKSRSDETDRMIRVDLTPRSDFARFHAINHRFFDEPRVPLRSVHGRPHRRFQNLFVIPRSKISHGNDVVLSDEIGDVDAENLNRRDSWKRLRFNQDYGRHRHQQRHQMYRDENDVSMPKRKFVGEKVKTREREADFMKGIRKFLTHSFD
ncbi:hypothetical protein L1987_02896 [Smallanthus sonchifolius]|uniref:Uncharacterized protein n=1 Tax=Smallanthus sonchifolius TaxID=185202 RepID=A0ACB9K931_9ASTR|nr:hypothetical protein L1987_02896 [Smallanthus sonchifolius]